MAPISVRSFARCHKNIKEIDDCPDRISACVVSQIRRSGGSDTESTLTRSHKPSGSNSPRRLEQGKKRGRPKDAAPGLRRRRPTKPAW